ncbi:endonuclease III domain-containing protein [Pampinifervens florentissimum]|uniref:endonuclease III domain-containing protein n=1 Tax=Pampinifervens florentissimum TaxID=1632019 RepID=UPI0013B4980B|nr:endonuclease III domain-containing protein [Hydrogenobacter sp. T-8]QID32911.1 endonuclease III domain-containing protein [Hydrogenobacter sp. T-8]
MKLLRLYELLLDLYGFQGWWPVDAYYHNLMGTDPRDEVIIGAVLTQNTSWKNVEKSLENLKREGELSLEFVRKVNLEGLKELIRPSGFYNQKAIRLKTVAEFINPTDRVKTLSREELLRVKGIGPETADAILLYAGERLSFVIDKYTQRFIKRFMNLEGDYHRLKNFFESNLPQDLGVYKEFHALIDEHAKRYCRSTPLCGECPLNSLCISASPSS